MPTPFGSVSPVRHLRLSAVIVPLILAACASNPPPDSIGPVDVGYSETEEQQAEQSVNTVQAEDEAVQRTRTLAEMLMRVPGVRVSQRGDDLRVRIRGGSSLLASEEPLVVIDGVVYSGALRSINPYAIDSITVLKNADETAIYGARGANGVIFIRSKDPPR